MEYVVPFGHTLFMLVCSMHLSFGYPSFAYFEREMSVGRFEEASQTLQQCLTELVGGATVGPLPLPSRLRLLQAVCEVCAGGEGVRRGRAICEDLLQCSPDDHLWRSKVMCVITSASLSLGEGMALRQLGVR